MVSLLLIVWLELPLKCDAEGWRPEQTKTDKERKRSEDRIYNRKDFDKIW